MSKIRFKFTRGEEVKYISHLDMMTMFERAARRAQIPLAYSQGFNPHPQMVFGLPLSVGVTSEAEYADFDLLEEPDLQSFMGDMNKALPKGFLITDAKYKHGKDNIMASITKASYCILVSYEKDDGIDIICKKITEFLNQPDIVIKKQSKSGVREVDVKPMIYDLKLLMLGERIDEAVNGGSSHCANSFINDYAKELINNNKDKYDTGFNNLFCITTFLSAGSAANLKPDLLISALSTAIQEEIKIIKIHRTGLYVERDKRTYEPLDFEILKVV